VGRRGGGVRGWPGSFFLHAGESGRCYQRLDGREKGGRLGAKKEKRSNGLQTIIRNGTWARTPAGTQGLRGRLVNKIRTKRGGRR